MVCSEKLQVNHFYKVNFRRGSNLFIRLEMKGLCPCKGAYLVGDGEFLMSFLSKGVEWL